MRVGKEVPPTYSADHIWVELWSSMPTLMAVLEAASGNVRRRKQTSAEYRNRIIMSVAILMNSRSPKSLKCLQTIMGLTLFDGHATKRVSIIVI